MEDFLDFEDGILFSNEIQNKQQNSMYEKEYSKLNEKQKEVVDTLTGAILVLAGAGTGKTKTIVTRIMNMILNNHCASNEILALTFTNKSANEMKRRISSAIGDFNYPLTWIGTFHSICTRILRMHSESIGLISNFNIIDQNEQLALIKDILKELNICTKTFKPQLVLSLMSKMENNKYSEVNKVSFDDEDDFLDLKKIQKLYIDRKKHANTVDFDDLILYVIEILKTNNEVLNKFQNKFKFIIVDEYQDTNLVQYDLLKILAGKYQNICCVGDEDQSIYGWRGADITNIFKFEKDFKNAKIIRLEENYRSNENIILCASNLIKNNNYRYDKTIFSKQKSNDRINVSLFNNDYKEYYFVAKKIKSEMQETKASEIVILIRSAFQARMLENTFINFSLKYHIVDGTKFYERMEIKDILSYLKIINSDHDTFSFIRIINVPKRGLGPKKIKSILNYSYENNLSIIDTLRFIIHNKVDSIKINKENINDIELFLKIIDSARKAQNKVDFKLSDLIKDIVKNSSYYDYLFENDEKDIANFRINNIEELANFIDTFDTLEEFLEYISLISATDETNKENSIAIMTMHAAKGLEYDIVFLPFWDEGSFPSLRSVENDTVEEERRLAYVSITRARKKVFISSSRNRRIFGKINSHIQSRFINEMKDGSYDISDYTNEYENYQSHESYDFNNKEESDLRIGMTIFHYKFGLSKINKIIGKFVEIVTKSDNIKRIVHKDDLKI